MPGYPGYAGLLGDMQANIGPMQRAPLPSSPVGNRTLPGQELPPLTPEQQMALLRMLFAQAQMGGGGMGVGR